MFLREKVALPAPAWLLLPYYSRSYYSYYFVIFVRVTLLPPFDGLYIGLCFWHGYFGLCIPELFVSPPFPCMLLKLRPEAKLIFFCYSAYLGLALPVLPAATGIPLLLPNCLS